MDKHRIKIVYRAECNSRSSMKKAGRDRSPAVSQVAQEAWERFCVLVDPCSIEEWEAVGELIRTRGNGS
jgi:3-deoxy-D-arabino-heptulosonate 7-phosphate (DAHP) synthase